MSITISKAITEDLPDLVPMLDAYRVFYKQSSDLHSAREFLEARFSRRDSQIYIGRFSGSPVGFVQLYHSFSTVSLQPIYILNDLYVIPSARGLGVGSALLKKAQSICIQKGYKGVALETGVDNPAKALYERLGWEKDVHCFHYFWTVP